MVVLSLRRLEALEKVSVSSKSISLIARADEVIE